MSLELRVNIPNQAPEVVPLTGSRVMIGTLPSNQLVLRVPGVEPIHAMIEIADDGQALLTDLGSKSGVKLNFKDLDVEASLKAGDTIVIGSVTITVAKHEEAAAVPPVLPGSAKARSSAAPTFPPAQSGGAYQGTVAPKHEDEDEPESESADNEPRGTVRASHGRPERRGEKKDLLFSPRKARPSGNVLEVVAYWGDTILDVDLFHPKYKGYERVIIGVPPKAHFIAGGEEDVKVHPFADVSENGYRLRMLNGMEARIRKDGEVFQKSGEAKLSLGRRDVAHISYGAVRYFLMFVSPPPLALPPNRARDPFFVTLMSLAFLFYVLTVPLLWKAKPKDNEDKSDDAWTLVNLPETQKPPEPEPKPKPKEEPKKPPEPPKPPQKVAEVKKEPPVKPPPPAPKPVQPAKPVEAEKPKQTKPVEAPKMKTAVATQAPPSDAEKEKPTPPQAKPAQPQQDNKAAGAPGAKSLDKLSKSAGMPSTGASKPDFKLAGPQNNKPLGAAGGDKGGGMNQAGGARAGKQSFSTMGVEGPQNNKASGVNLSKLGLSAGKILDKTGPGAIQTNFQNSAGGAGGGAGSASKTYGLGGMGAGNSLGVAGAGGAINNFGSGSGGAGGGQGGLGGLGGNGLGAGFGSKGSGAGGANGSGGRASVNIPPGDPVVSGGLTAQEVQAVIRANLNQIRHCYEQLLQRSPNASGKVKVAFVVGTDGRVTSASIQQSSITDSVMQGCVTGKVQRWKFPQPRGGQPVNVSYPFVFNPL